MTTNEVREKYLKFFESKGHKIIPPAPLVLDNDPTTLFTSSGMQPLVPYLMGEPHPEGKRVTDSQPSIRIQDIEEVGDNRHTTFFEMLGNWSFGDYFKKEQLPWIWEFLTKELGLPKEKLYVSIFEGNDSVPRDEESYNIWRSLGVAEDHIFEYGVKKNWWSRSGTPEQMPAGEIGGPDSEIFFEFDSVEHDPKFGEKCYPNCDCGRFLEIGNSVFIQYKKKEDGTLEELPQKNVDFGGGLERIASTFSSRPDVFWTDAYKPILSHIMGTYMSTWDEESSKNYRIIADHLKASVFLIANGVLPSNKQQGYILRRLIRRAIVRFKKIGEPDFLLFQENIPEETIWRGVAVTIVNMYKDSHLKEANAVFIGKILDEEALKFSKTLDKGLKEFEKLSEIDGNIAFDLYQTYGFPLELTLELAQEKNLEIDVNEFKKAFEEHQDKSRSASSGTFKGGLADRSLEVTRLHTVHHLVLAALQKIIDPNIVQKGSNITSERMRMDFNLDRKLTSEEIKKIEDLVNEKISEDLKVTKKIMLKNEAEKLGAQMEFGKKYPDNVSVYFVGPEDNLFSVEFCGGPHVESLAEISGRVTIFKEESVSSGVRRLYAKIIPANEE